MKILMILSIFLLGACAHTTQPKMASFNKGTRTPAQDNSETVITHVSKNGRYVAFFEETSLDGSGAYETAFRILDMKEDKYVFTKTLVSTDSESVDEATYNKIPAEQRADLLLLAKAKIASFGLKPSKLQPLQNYSTLNKGGTYANEQLTYKGAFLIKNKTYGFEITTSKVVASEINKKSNWCLESGFDIFKYNMTVNGKLVHEDKRLPLSRGCAMSYGVDKVYDINGTPLLFIRYTRIGFEGPDYRTITLPLNNI